MDLMHHDVVFREEDGQQVCSRCGVVNPQDNQPCIPLNMEPTQPDVPA